MTSTLELNNPPGDATDLPEPFPELNDSCSLLVGNDTPVHLIRSLTGSRLRLAIVLMGAVGVVPDEVASRRYRTLQSEFSRRVHIEEIADIVVGHVDLVTQDENSGSIRSAIMGLALLRGLLRQRSGVNESSREQMRPGHELMDCALKRPASGVPEGEMVIRALPAVGIRLERLCQRYSGRELTELVPTGISSPSEGVALVNDVNELVANHLIHCSDLEDRIGALEDILGHIPNDGPSHRVSEIVRKHVGAHYQGHMLSRNLLRCGYEIDPNEVWRLVIDGDVQSTALRRYCFENESGYLEGTLRAFNMMFSELHLPLDAQMYCRLHDEAVAGVYKRNGFQHKALFQLGYRECRVSFPLIDGVNSTTGGLREFMTSEKSAGDWISLRAPQLDKQGELVLPRKSASECLARARLIIDQYYDEISTLHRGYEVVRKNRVLAAIARCCRDLNQHHLFAEGNIRTIGFLTVNRLLLEQGLVPTILRYPKHLGIC